ncbi:hypothetical protein KKG46_05495 [Patescibacteria group bacterium]|nr:hypothetical protein [Patescibacteria group bacterium]
MTQLEKDRIRGPIVVGLMFALLILSMIVFAVKDDDISAIHKTVKLQERQQEVDQKAQNITYTKDIRTGLCFAFSGPNFTHVPCDKVQKPIANSTNP